MSDKHTMKSGLKAIIHAKWFLPSLLIGSIASWLIKGGFTLLITNGKSFDGRSLPVQIAILATLAVITTLLVFLLLSFFDRIYRWKKKLLLLSLLCLGMIFVEFFVFNGGFLFGRVLQERQYSISQGALYQFELENGALIAQSVDPNITFLDINLPIAAVSINCANSVPGANGQVFYAGSGERFSEERSIRYTASSPASVLFLDAALGIPQPVMISGLRFDLTDAVGDSLTCSEFLINPRIPFSMTTARLLVYGGVLTLFVMYSLGSIQYLLTRKIKYKNEVIGFILIEYLQLIAFDIAGVPINDEFVLLKVTIITCVSLCLSFAICYIGFHKLFSFAGNHYGDFASPFFFAILIVVSYFPILTGKYFVHDDFLNFTGTFQNIFPISVTTGRIGAGLYVDLFYKMTVENSFYGRAVAVVGVLLIFLLFNRWMENIGFAKKTSLVTPFLCLVSLPFLNISAYVMEFTFIWAALFSCLSAVLFIKSLEFLEGKKNFDFIVHITVSFVSILLTFFTYQATSTVGFALIAAYLLNRHGDRPRILLRTAIYYLYFGMAAIAYLFLNKFLGSVYHLSATIRTELIANVADALYKLEWFLTIVLPQSVKQLQFIFGGKLIFTQEYSWVYLHYWNFLLGAISLLPLGAIVILGGMYFLKSFSARQKLLSRDGVLSILLLATLIPYSYFFLLVTRESSYLTFYVSGLVAVMMTILVVWGGDLLCRYVKNPQNIHRIFVLGIIPVLALISFNNNRYLYTMWVRDNDFNYHYIKKQLQNSDLKSRRIHIIGSTGEVDIYWINATKLALRELGISPDSYNISYSDSEYLVNQIEASRFAFVSKALTQDDISFLTSYYIYNASFGYYYLKPDSIDPQSLERFKSIFQKTGIIPLAEEQAILIDMRKIK